MKRFTTLMALLLAATILLCACGQAPATPTATAPTSPTQAPEPPDEVEKTASALVPKPMAPNAVSRNPYMADSDNSVHNDSYSSDVTDAVLPLGIGSFLAASLETQNKVSSPSAAFFDEDNYPVTPVMGGVAIIEMNGKLITRKGAFVPSHHDTENYSVQISYSFVDRNNNIVMPTSHGHIIIVQTRDENGGILPIFKKIVDIDLVAYAKAALGQDVDPRLLSVVYDYCGNLWFVTGGFRIYPDRDPAGFMGYVSRAYFEQVEQGQAPDVEEHLYLHRLSQGESAENGISSNEDGAVILTNKSCYMLGADDGVQIKWKVDYESNGANDAQEGSGYTGGGLAYGGGSTPTLTKDLVLFTDNADPVNLIAVSSKTGQVVVKTPVLDTLGDDVPVSVENSILVYSAGEERTSVLVCNWFGAGNAALSDPDSDSSVQSYDALYDKSWIAEGNRFIAPGVQRVDVVKEGDSYTSENKWLRSDLRDTSMIKLSTATGYLYGYWQDLDSGMWCFGVLDFETGETVLQEDVSSLAAYNNMAVGMIADVRGNTLYCPTNNMDIVRWQDRFVSLPELPAKEIDPNDMERYHLTADAFAQASGTDAQPMSFLMKVKLGNIPESTAISFRLNGLEGAVTDLSLFYQAADGSLEPFEGQWKLFDDAGKEQTGELQPDALYELRFDFDDNTGVDTDPANKQIELAVILAR